jgi:CubicO group peptidase (beta-lactamase class C family)
LKVKIIITLSTLFFSQLILAKGTSNKITNEIASVESGLRSSTQFANDPQWNIKERMKHYGVPGVSVAVIKDYKIHWVKHYGVTDKETGQAVNNNTLFQAGSISKPVAAYGALKFVEQGKLSLDEPVNQKLKDWKIPDNDFTSKQPVALKHILNHSAGLTVHGFGGYAPGTPVPTVKQILDGEKPANSDAVRVNMQPETQFRYSGGGYTVMQKLVSDVAQKEYTTLMQELVLGPIGMTQSTYEQPLPPAKLKYAAAGYLPNNSPVIGKRHTYPEMAAAGLWTTAEDLAKFAIDVQLAIKSDKSKVLSQKMTNKMLTPFVSESTGLGFFINKKGKEIYFGHGGWDEGFSADLIAHKTRGYGVVIMTNSNHPAFIDELKNSVASTYQWNKYLDSDLVSLPIDKTELDRIAGRYNYTPDMTFKIYANDDKLYMQYLNGNPMEVFRIGENQFVRREFPGKFRFEKNKDSGATDLIFGINNETEHVRKRMNDNVYVPLEWLIKGDLKKTEKVYQEYFVKYPDSKEEAERDILVYADQLDKKNKSEETINVMKMSVRLFPDSINSIGSLAMYYKEKGNNVDALIAVKKALKVKPDDKRALEALKELTKE